MSLDTSRKYPKEPASYGKEVGRQMRLLLTGGGVALALVLLSLYTLLRGPIVLPGPGGEPLAQFVLPLWAVVILACLFLMYVQYRVWAVYSDRLFKLTRVFYTHHPEADHGIEIRYVKRVDPNPLLGSSEAYLLVSMSLTEYSGHYLLGTCDGPATRARLEYRLPTKQAKKTAGITPPARVEEQAEMSTPTIFKVKRPFSSLPVLAELHVYGDPLPAVTSIEWA